MRTVVAFLMIATTSFAADRRVHRHLPYAEPKGERQTLDLYALVQGKGHPIVSWIHGGGWQAGDKCDVQANPRAIVDKGFVFVSTNYRLLPEATIKEIAGDVANAIGWVHDPAREYGGDPDTIFVMGHSGGAQPAALICTDDRYLKAEDQPAIAFEKRSKDLMVTIGGQLFATYAFEDGPITRPFFKHLHAPDGTQVTRNHPPEPQKDLADHPTFHPGLWLAFGDLNGADFWRNKDRIRHIGFVEEPRSGPGRGSFAVKNQYESGGRIIGTEIAHFMIRVRPAGYLLFWDSEFTPRNGDLTFGDQEEMGLGVRMATPLAVVKGGRITNSDGLKDEAQVWGKTADWCAYAGTVDGRRVGVVLMPHPKNFRHSWFHARDYGLLVANPFGRNAFTKEEKSKVVVREGETLRLRFGVLFFSGEPDLSAAYRDYLQQTR